MSCLICGNNITIKAHLIPRALAREVQVGKAHAVAHGPNFYEQTQSGLYEKDILCGDCDNKLGAAENVATQTFREIRRATATPFFSEQTLKGVAGNSILRFVCGVLWKYSVASRKNGKINLGPYQDTVRDVAFSRINVPEAIDALVLRLKRHDDDGDVFGYRAPKPDRQEGANGYRLLVGGVFIFAKIDKQTPRGGALERGSIRDKADLPYAVMRAQDFEEYRSMAKLAHSNSRLTKFLEKQEDSSAY